MKILLLLAATFLMLFAIQPHGNIRSIAIGAAMGIVYALTDWERK